jgi:hypothetical protein
LFQTLVKNNYEDWAQCLIPVVSATGEAEIRRIVVQGHPRQKVSKTPSQPTSQLWWFTPVIPAMRETVGRRISVQAYPVKDIRPYLKKTQTKKAGVWLK